MVNSPVESLGEREREREIESREREGQNDQQPGEVVQQMYQMLSKVYTCAGSLRDRSLDTKATTKATKVWSGCDYPQALSQIG